MKSRSIPLRFLFLAAVVFSAIASSSCGGASVEDLVAKSKSMVDQRDFKAAVITLKSAAQKKPGDPEVRFLLGRTLLLIGDAGPAIVELNRALELGYDENKVVPALSQAMGMQGQAEQVIKRFAQTSLSDRRASADLKVELALSHARLGKQEILQQVLLEALETDPTNARANIIQARIKFSKGDIAGASKIVSEVLARDSNYAHAWLLKGIIERLSAKDNETAKISLKRAIELDPALVYARSEYLSLLFESKDKVGIRENIKAMEKTNPNSISTHIFKAQLEYLEGNTKASKDIVQQLLRANPPDPRALMLAATLEYHAGNLAQTETHLNRILQVAPNDEQSRLLLAGTHMRAGQMPKAMSALQPLLELPSPPASALAMAGEVQVYAGQAAKAEAFFRRAVGAQPGEQKYRAWAALARIGQGDFQSGLNDLEKIAASDPGTFADLAVVNAKMKLNDLNGAIAALGRLESKQPNRPLTQFMLGSVHLKKKDAATARASFEKALSIDPSFFQAAATLAAMDLDEKNITKAKSRFQNILEKDPKAYKAGLALAGLMGREKAPVAAIRKVLNDVISGNPGEAEPRLALLESLLAGNEAKAAVSVAQEALVIFPDNIAMLDALGRALTITQEYQQAISTFKKVSAIRPDLPQPHIRLSELYWEKKEPDAASDSLRRALEIAPNMVTIQARLVNYAIAQKKYSEAIAITKKVQASNPKNGVGFMLEADVYRSQGQWEPALKASKAAFERSPNSELASRMHDILFRAGKPEEADRFGRDWLKNNSNDSAMMYQMGGSALAREDWTNAETYFRQMLTVDAKSGVALNNLSWVLQRQKKPGAVQLALQADEAMPNNATVLDTLASALAAEGQFAKAIEVQKRAVSIARDDNRMVLGLARIILRSGDKVTAKAELEKLAYLGDRFAGHEEVSRLLKTLQ
jgi:cellulose synthase operon protein C